LEVLKDFDRLNAEHLDPDRFKDIKYVEREDDPELKAMYE